MGWGIRLPRVVPRRTRDNPGLWDAIPLGLADGDCQRSTIVLVQGHLPRAVEGEVPEGVVVADDAVAGGE